MKSIINVLINFLTYISNIVAIVIMINLPISIMVSICFQTLQPFAIMYEIDNTDLLCLKGTFLILLQTIGLLIYTCIVIWNIIENVDEPSNFIIKITNKN